LLRVALKQKFIFENNIIYMQNKFRDHTIIKETFLIRIGEELKKF